MGLIIWAIVKILLNILSAIDFKQMLKDKNSQLVEEIGFLERTNLALDEKEKDEFIKASLIGDSDMSTLTEELSILEMEKESIDLEKRKLSRHSETLRESIHMTKKILDKRGGGFQC